MSKVKDKIRKEGKDRKKDVVGLPGIFYLLPFLLDVMTSLQIVELVVLNTEVSDSIQVGFQYNLVTMRSKRRREKR